MHPGLEQEIWALLLMREELGPLKIIDHYFPILSIFLFFFFFLICYFSLCLLCFQVFSRVHATLYVTMSVRRSVCPSVGPSVGRKSLRSKSFFWAFRAEWRSDLSYCPCPTTILPLPTRTRLMLPCIRPCFSN